MADGDAFYDEIEIEDMTYDATLQIFHYPCPCGDRFEIAIADLRDGEEVAVCPGCSLTIKVIFDVVSAWTSQSSATSNFSQGDLPKDDGGESALTVPATTVAMTV